MKDSGVEWIGEIPEDWEIDRVKYHFKIISGSGFPIERQGKENGDYPVCKASDIADANKSGVLYSAANFLDKKDILGYNIVPKDSIIMPKIGEAMKKNNRAITGCDVLVDNNCQGLFSTSMDVKYAYYLFRIIDMNWFDNAGTIPCVNNTRLINSSIPYPSYKEQRNISNKIDKKVKVFENIESKITIQIQALEDYKKSVITEAVTKGLDKNVKMKDSGIEWIGEIPKHWELVKLKHIAEKISKGISPKYVEQQITPVVNQATFSNGVFNYDLKYCSDKPIGEGLLKKDDVLLATTGGGVLGKTYLFEEEGNYLASTDVAYLRFKNKNLSKLVYYILSVNYELLNGVYGKGSTNQTHLQMNMLSNMEIPITDLEELNQIIQAIDEKCSYIDEAITAKQKQLETLEEYKKSLIYEYVTGKKEVEDVGTI